MSPMYMLYLTCGFNNLIVLLVFINLVLSTIMAFESINYKFIILDSSVYQTATMAMLMMTNKYAFTSYIMVYVMVTGVLMYFYNNLKINNKADTMGCTITYEMKILMVVSLFTYTSLPPMVTFVTKWMLIESSLMETSLFDKLTMTTMVTSIMMTWNFLSLFSTYFHNIIPNFFQPKETKVPNWILLYLMISPIFVTWMTYAFI